MENVLIISSNSTASESLTEFIRGSFQCDVRNASSAAEGKTIVCGNRSWELVLINLPLSDGSGLELAEFIADSTEASCIIMVKAETAERVMDRADKNGIIVVTKPFSKNVLYQIVKAVDQALRRSWSLYEETVRLERKIGEIQLIDKAKFRLMQYMNMTEDEAHSYLEQYAMKKRLKKTVAASEIIDSINEEYL